MPLLRFMQPQSLDEVKQKPQLIAVSAVAGTTNGEELDLACADNLITL
jgi:hypothetical protein